MLLIFKNGYTYNYYVHCTLRKLFIYFIKMNNLIHYPLPFRILFSLKKNILKLFQKICLDFSTFDSNKPVLPDHVKFNI